MSINFKAEAAAVMTCIERAGYEAKTREDRQRG